MEGMSSSEVEALKRKHAEELEGHVRNHNQKYTDMLTERMNAEEELMEKLREEEEKGKRQGEEIKKLQQLILNKDDEIAQLKVQHQGEIARLKEQADEERQRMLGDAEGAAEQKINALSQELSDTKALLLQKEQSALDAKMNADRVQQELEGQVSNLEQQVNDLQTQLKAVRYHICTSLLLSLSLSL
eukprot:TRINITY_DN263_c0_g2_i17.p1 TRINITY_DN263_c0_g2~~TRINITY_DN263_c0_g2_i17.p1  ORF type:complete len:187 (-),score=71.37 TRINITY_DN263_c0_g2_i17:210-770(-)